MDEAQRRAAPKIEYEAVVVQPAVDALTRALLEATPSSWGAVQLVLSFGGAPPVVTSPEGRAETVALTPRIGLALAMLDRLRVDRGTGWSGGVLVARRGADGTWQAALDWHYGGLANSAPAPRSSSVTGAMPAVSGDGAARYEALVGRAEAELAGGDPVDALATLGEALVALPGETFERAEAGWIFVRMAGIRLAIGDARGAARNAQSALRCAGWANDARALLRLGQAQQVLGDDAAGATLVAAYRAGGDTWFASVAPELLAWVRAASAAG